MALVALIGHSKLKTSKVKARISKTLSDHAVANSWWSPSSLPEWLTEEFWELSSAAPSTLREWPRLVPSGRGPVSRVALSTFGWIEGVAPNASRVILPDPSVAEPIGPTPTHSGNAHFLQVSEKICRDW
jgi:hypothetical protein